MKRGKGLSGGSCQQNCSPGKSSEGVLWDPSKLLQNLLRIRRGDVQAGATLKAQSVPR